MSIPNYPININIPDAPNNPALDQPIMKMNNANMYGVFSVDHVTPGTLLNGIHQQVNMPISSSPTLLGDLVLYARVDGGVTSLWAKNSTFDWPLFKGNANGGINGYSSTIGGIIYQWGKVSPLVSGSAQPVSFNTPFTTCFNIQLTPIGASTNNAQNLSVISESPTGFSYLSQGVNPIYSGLYWMAIGQ